jgi:hypothetical protein
MTDNLKFFFCWWYSILYRPMGLYSEHLPRGNVSLINVVYDAGASAYGHGGHLRLGYQVLDRWLNR